MILHTACQNKVRARWLQKMTERRNLCGETYRLQSNFASIPTLLKKLFCSSAYIIRKRWARRGLGKTAQKQKNREKLKHCDDLNRALRVGGQKRNMQMKRSMWVQHKTEEDMLFFNNFMACRNKILEPHYA